MIASATSSRRTAPRRPSGTWPPARRFSPNGDGRSDTASLTARVLRDGDWRFRIKAPGGATIVDRTGHGTSVDLSWDALTGGAAVADGAYTWSLQATDTWENGPTTRTGTITVDTKAPSLAAVTPRQQRVRWISPNGDRAKESMPGRRRSEAGSLRLKVADCGRRHGPEYDVQRQGRGQRDGDVGREGQPRRGRPGRHLQDHA